MFKHGIRINKYRIGKAYDCFKYGMESGRNPWWSFRLALWWFSAGFTFEGDGKKTNLKSA
jgi:hypothetical protein